MNIIDILIIILIFIGAFKGYQKGLINSLAEFLGNILGVVIAAHEYLKIFDWLNQHFSLDQVIEPQVYKLILPSLSTKVGSIEQNALTQILGSLPQEWSKFFSSSNLAGINIIPQEILEQIAHNIAGKLTTTLLHLLSFALVYLAVIVIVQILVTIVLKPLGFFGLSMNGGGGFIFGGLSAFIGLVVLAGLISPFVNLNLDNKGILLLNQSLLFDFLQSTFRYLSNIFFSQLSTELLNPLNSLNSINQKGIWY